MRFSIFSVQDHHPSFPRTIPELYQQVLQQGELADQLGYDTFFVAEHHFHEYGAVPNPAVFLSALAQRTKRIRLGPAISILPFHHPLTLAENYAMLDILSGGRLVLGVGSGYLQHEFSGYGVDPQEKRDRFDEHLLILKKALSGERFSHKGKFTSCENVQLNVRPLQKNVPLYAAILRREAAYHVGRQGHHVICVPYASVDQLGETELLLKEHRDGFSESGTKEEPSSLLAFHAHVAETDAAARANAEDAFNLYVRTRLYAKQQTYEDVLRSGLHLFGSPETVIKKLHGLRSLGADHVLLLMNFGLLDPEKVKSSMKLFAEKIMPVFQQQQQQ